MDANDDFEDEIDIMEFLASKGVALEPFKNEYVELQKQVELTSATNVGKEREVDMQALELKMLREQLIFTKRNIDELVSQQEVLKETIDNAQSKKEALIESESSNRKEISNVSSFFAELKEALTVGADWTPEQEEARHALEKERDFIASKLENKSNQLKGLRHDIERTYEHVADIEKVVQSLEEKIGAIDKQRGEIKRESAKLASKKEGTEKQVFDLRAVFVTKESELNDKYRQLAMEEKSLKNLEASIAKSKSQMDHYNREYEKLFHTLKEYNSDLEKCQQQNQKYQEEIAESTKAIETVEHEIKQLKKELKQFDEERTAIRTKIGEIEAQKHEMEKKIDQINKQILNIRDHEIGGVHKEMETLDKTMANLRQQLEILRKKHIGSEKTSKAMADLIILNSNGKLNLGMEIRILEEEVEHHKAQIRALLAEKEKYEHDAEVATQQYYTAVEELKLQEMQIHELNKKITQDQMRLKQKQSLYESVRSDRNLFSKQLLDAQEEIQELKRKFRSMNQMIDQINDDITTKDKLIVKEHFSHHAVDKEKELLKNELMKIKKQVQASEGIIENQRVEIMKLQRIIEEADTERQRQRNELSSVVSERNLLTQQLVKRNEELNNMYEKIKTQRSDLKIGERNYTKYMEDLRRWQEQVRDIVTNHNDVVVQLSQLETLRHRVVHLERDILKEKTRSRALMDELETPMNVHRWRILESSDPKRYDKILQIQALQRQLVAMSDQVIQNDLLIQEKEKIYIELKHVVARHPGPEVEEQILVYQQTLKDKHKQLAAMNLELEMYIEQVKRFKEDIADADVKIQRLNKQWMSRQKKMAKEAQAQAQANNAMMSGGYAMSMPPQPMIGYGGSSNNFAM